jgi:hypothetical protein
MVLLGMVERFTKMWVWTALQLMICINTNGRVRRGGKKTVLMEDTGIPDTFTLNGPDKWPYYCSDVKYIGFSLWVLS